MARAERRPLSAGRGERRGAHRDARFRPARSPRLDSRSPDRAHLRAGRRLSEVGQQFLGEQHPPRSPAAARATATSSTSAGSISCSPSSGRASPTLLIENCSGGGNRLDLGLMRYTDVGWMDDRTSPSAHVRHNLQGLTTFLPPAYLLSYLIGHATSRCTTRPTWRSTRAAACPASSACRLRTASSTKATSTRIRGGDRRMEGVSRRHRLGERAAAHRQVNSRRLSPAGTRSPLISPGARPGARLRLSERSRRTRRCGFVLRGLDPAATYELRWLESTRHGSPPARRS